MGNGVQAKGTALSRVSMSSLGFIFIARRHHDILGGQ